MDRAVDEDGKRCRVVIRLEPGANADVESEATGAAIDQVEPRHADLELHNTANTIDFVGASDTKLKAMGKARQVGIGVGVLVYSRHQAIERTAAHLQDGVKIAGQCIRHVEAPYGDFLLRLMWVWIS